MTYAVVVAIALPASVGAQDESGQAVVRLENALGAAVVKHDSAVMGKLLAADFTFVSTEGRIVNKAQWVKEVLADSAIVRGINSEMKPRVHGSTVIITGVWTETVKLKTGTEDQRYRWTDTWMKGADGQWQCIGSQGAFLAKK